MKIGYARVSTMDQNPDLQHQALKAAGCERIFEDRISGSSVKRPGLDQALSLLGPNDMLVVWRLDRLGRSLPHLIEVLSGIGEIGAGFRSLAENIDTTTASGRLMFHMMGALAEFERALIVERTRAGLDAARKRGQLLGRQKILTAAQIDQARHLIAAGETPATVARGLKVGRATLYRALKRADGKSTER